VEVLLQEGPLGEAGADLAAFALHEGDDLPAELAAAPGAEDARAGFRKLALLHPGSQPHVLAAGLGSREEADAERLRRRRRARREAAGARGALARLALPDSDARRAAEALVTGTILAAYRFDRFRGRAETRPAATLESLTLLGAASVAAAPSAPASAPRRRTAPATCRTCPPTSPRRLPRAAPRRSPPPRARSAPRCSAARRSRRRDGRPGRGQPGRDEEPQLIVLRYAGGGPGPTLGLVGKGVTFDTGGISLKPSASMHEMKMDMSGAAAVLEAVGAIAELGLPVDLIAVIPSTENMPSGTAISPATSSPSTAARRSRSTTPTPRAD
jgi:leucyl aminopeptidase